MPRAVTPNAYVQLPPGFRITFGGAAGTLLVSDEANPPPGAAPGGQVFPTGREPSTVGPFATRKVCQLSGGQWFSTTLKLPDGSVQVLQADSADPSPDLLAPANRGITYTVWPGRQFLRSNATADRAGTHLAASTNPGPAPAGLQGVV